MTAYWVGRGLQTAVSLLGVLVIVFFASRITGDPARLMLPPDATRDDYQDTRQALGLDEPVYYQFGLFLKNAVRGDFGQSYRWHQPSMDVVLPRLPATLELSAVAFAISIAIAVPFGILSAVYKNSALDRVARTIAIVAHSMPSFWLGIMLIVVFAAELRWLPSAGRGGISHLVLPAVTLGLYGTAAILRLLRSATIDVLASDYIRMARMAGVAERTVILKYAVRNAAIPVVTLLSVQWGYLLAGSVVVETVFAWPGVGRTLVEAIQSRDFPVVQAAVVVLSALIATMYLVMDVLYGLIDPRIRYQAHAA